MANEMSIQEKALIFKIGPNMGYGRMMQLAQECWRESLIAKDYPPGGEFAYGPCVASTVPCGCENQVGCDWCCGSGWLTKHVKEIKDSIALEIPVTEKENTQ